MPGIDAAIAADCAAIGRIDAVGTVLKVLAQTTGLRISLVARVTEDSWTCCAVHDDAEFGLGVGDTLDVATTY